MPDPRLDRLAEIVKPEKVIPTTMEFVDIAGLVAGASKGEGLGNQFLAHIRETDAVAQVLRCFEDDDVHHVDGRVDPISDAETINTELALADLETVEKALSRVERQTKSGDKEAVAKRDVLLRVRDGLGEGHSVRSLALDEAARALIADLHLITIKPLMYIANVAEDGFEDNPSSIRSANWPGPRPPRWCRCAPPLRRNWPRWTTRTRRSFWPSTGWRSRG